jgi:serpin B
MNSSTFRCARVLSLAAVALAGAVGCQQDDGDVIVDEVRSQQARETRPAVAPADRQTLAEGNVAFAQALYHQVQAKNPNLVFSPVSISTALAMTYAGARGETETQMAAALRFGLPQARLHPAMNELTAALDARGEGTQGADGKPFRLNIVNTTWAQKGFTMESPFLDVLAASYGAGVHLLDFIAAPEPSRLQINRWVEQQTEARIKDLIPEGIINGNTRLVLTNAVYFNAAWKFPFTKKTQDAPFTRMDGSSAMVPMMRNEVRLRAVTQPGLVAVSLPYQDERLSMLVVLPDAGQLTQVEGRLSSQGLTGVTSGLREEMVILGLPRFRFETPIDLKEALSTLGMPIAFSNRADFSGIHAAGGLMLQAVLHKAFIAVAEKGTEAAAATAVVVGRTSLPVGLNVEVNRPFLFFVLDEPTGAILFQGRVADPAR